MSWSKSKLQLSFLTNVILTDFAKYFKLFTYSHFLLHLIKATQPLRHKSTKLLIYIINSMGGKNIVNKNIKIIMVSNILYLPLCFFFRCSHVAFIKKIKYKNNKNIIFQHHRDFIKKIVWIQITRYIYGK